MLLVLAVAATATALSAFDYGIAKTGRSEQEGRLSRHMEVMRHDVGSPIRYRVLTPALIEVLTRPARVVFTPEVAFKRVFTLFTFAEFTLLLFTHYLYFRTWFSPEQAMVGMLIIGATLRVTLQDFAVPYQPWSFLEPSLIALGLLAIAHGRTYIVLVLTVIASLNRETGVLVPVALVIDAAARKSPRDIAIGAVGILLSVAVFFWLRETFGYAASVLTVAEIWHWNKIPEAFRGAVQNVVLFLGGAGWLLAAGGAVRAPRFVKRTFWLGLFYLPLYLVFGIWLEVRLLMPLYPVLVPMILSCLFRPSDTTTIGAVPAPTV
jgi:hypothetical protein